MKILIVEDEKVSQKKMQFILDKYAFCDVAATGLEAIHLFKESWRNRSPYDIVTLDISLTDMSGIDILVKFRKIEEELGDVCTLNRAKVLMVTAHEDKEYITSSIVAGCDGYIVKPFITENIRRCLREVYIKYLEEAFS